MTAIESKVSDLLNNGFDVGSPLAGESEARGGGTMQEYENAILYNHPAIGCFEVHGLILQKYNESGGVEASALGYPTSDEMDNPDVEQGRMNTFQFGKIIWSAEDGAVIVSDDPSSGNNASPEDNSGDEDNWFENLPKKIVVKLKNESSFASAETLNLSDLVKSNDLDNLSFEKMYAEEDSAYLNDLGNTAKENDGDYIPPDFSTYFSVDVPKDTNTEAVISQLQQNAEVEFAYEELPPVECLVNPSDDPAAIFQNYMFAAPVGIDATSAWDKNITGSGIQIIDIEHGWDLSHEDLPASIPLTGFNNLSAHGTAVLGEICAVDNDKGIVGIASDSGIQVVSIFKSKFSFSTENALKEAIKKCSAGDIILIELQDPSLFPIEIVPGVFQLMELATKANIIIIEPAGNGGFDLDKYKFFLNGKNIFKRTSTDFKDSGSIMVGAASSADPHTRMSFSNFGSRIDCYAWGENVETLGNKNTYINNFNGTSSASPIITGAAALLQQHNVETKGNRLTPAEMRNILSDATKGTASANPALDRIGVMPDLSKTIQ